MTSFHNQMFSIKDGARAGKKYTIMQVFPKLKTYLIKKRKILELTELDTIENKIIVKSNIDGDLVEIHVKKGDVIELGTKIITVEDCSHPTVMGNICCDCGIVLDTKICDNEVSHTQALVSMLHSIPDLKVSQNEAKRLGDEDISNLLRRKKLVLLVDLDQTLIHTTNDNIPPNIKDVFHFQLIRNGRWYHTRLRPHTKSFLEKISVMYELHICTFGVREYAHCIAKFLDADQKLFGHRILSRNECLDSMSKKANLNSLFPCGDNLVCIIDDRFDVWNFAPNVVQVTPYHFFKHTGDINAPPGLQKKENDEKGFDFDEIETKLDKSNSTAEMGYSNFEAAINKTVNEKLDKIERKNIKSTDENISDLPKEKEEINSLSKKVSEIPSEDTNIGDDTNLKVTEDKINIHNRIENNCIELKIESVNETNIDEDNIAKEIDKCQKYDSSADDVKIAEKIKSESKTENLIDVTDNDDYLLYLEDILKRLHSNFYKQYSDTNELPDLKNIVQNMRAEVLSGVNLVFSSIVPNDTPLMASRPYLIAIGLGATVNLDLQPKSYKLATTHLIAANLKTEKCRKAKKMGIKIVSPGWLWCCAERWERVDERLFEVDESSMSQREPPFCLPVFPPHLKNVTVEIHSTKESKKRPHCEEKTNLCLMDDINPLVYLSEVDTKSMQNEVDLELSDDSDESDDKGTDEESEPCLESSESDTEPSRKRKRLSDDPEETNDQESEDELPSVLFRQGNIPSDVSDGESDDQSMDADELDAFANILEREMMQ